MLSKHVCLSLVTHPLTRQDCLSDIDTKIDANVDEAHKKATTKLC